MNKRLVYFFILLIAALLLLVTGFVWNEARKEVTYLCGNFTSGVTEESVIRQLETGHFLRYRREAGSRGETIVVDSAYTLGIHRCTIELGADRKVVRAGVE